jgi:hypothetical protein
MWDVTIQKYGINTPGLQQTLQGNAGMKNPRAMQRLTLFLAFFCLHAAPVS